jgi:hypothetical protein
MAEAIDLNEGKPFGGAVVIIPPGDGPPVEILTMDSRQDGLQFYSNIKTLADIEYNNLLKREQEKRVFGGMR